MGLIAALKNNKAVAYPVGLIFAAACLVLFLSKAKNAADKAAKVA